MTWPGAFFGRNAKTVEQACWCVVVSVLGRHLLWISATKLVDTTAWAVLHHMAKAGTIDTQTLSALTEAMEAQIPRN
ncbi:hypothetical protein [Arthrobacter bambusae]|uniref:hypothetical protein n=1 Tax=Arthrobacter bambusae TaxID=1338426 RepID=UPI0027851C1F|nr:hypothetical protein [Arthrobacter bambusae]MDQ0028749.1 ribosomal protein L19E [Arthrobacter bambusae]MDQ0096458.1 ribosomal protein L19E [Arthrobacter bambusae]